jgi:hypothetical protein
MILQPMDHQTRAHEYHHQFSLHLEILAAYHSKVDKSLPDVIAEDLPDVNPLSMILLFNQHLLKLNIAHHASPSEFHTPQRTTALIPI